MRSVCHAALSSLGLLALMSGCYHYGYSPYGGYPGPAAYPVAPGGTYMSPSSPTYVPNNGASPGMSPTPLAPNGTTTSPGGGAIPWRPDPNGTNSGGSAIPYEASPDRTVPDPIDPNDTDRGFGPDPNGASVTPPFSPFASGSGVQLQPIETSPTLAPGAAAATGTLAENDPFEAPMRSVSNGSTVTAKPTKHGGSDGRRPFGFDTRNYTWLRGYIDFDPQDQRWIILFSATPESSDRYGGSLTLQDHRLLGQVKPQDHVYIEGRVDELSFDQHGKPMYVIDKMWRLK